MVVVGLIDDDDDDDDASHALDVVGSVANVTPALLVAIAVVVCAAAVVVAAADADDDNVRISYTNNVHYTVCFLGSVRAIRVFD